jgi:UrcA family protein
MRPFAIVCGLLLAACPAQTIAHSFAQDAPVARVRYGDLNLRRADGRAELVSRVRDAAVLYCRDHAHVVTPAHRRGDRYYCVASLRVQIVEALPPRVRRAYDLGWDRRP